MARAARTARLLVLAALVAAGSAGAAPATGEAVAVVIDPVSVQGFPGSWPVTISVTPGYVIVTMPQAAPLLTASLEGAVMSVEWSATRNEPLPADGTVRGYLAVSVTGASPLPADDPDTLSTFMVNFN